MKTNNAKYKLNVLATPIGNINEVSKRFIDTISTTDVILSEDTRNTKKLLNLLNIQKNFKFIKFELHNENQIADEIVHKIKNDGFVYSLVSDAGYPTISDPGYKLINKCIENEIAINVINGPSSIIHALVASGMMENDFLFLGFLGKTKNERIKKLIKYSNLELTFVIFESPHRLKKCLEDINEVLYEESKICIARELTKLHEEFVYYKLKDLPYNDEYCGEFVILIKNKIKENNNKNEINQEIKQLINKNYHSKEISKLIAEKYNINQNIIYKKVIEMKK